MKPWLWIPPKWAHDLSLYTLPSLSFLYEDRSPRWRPVNWRGLEFRNPLGVAGGVDKNARLVNSFWRMGVGFVEVGTITPLPQKSNAAPILARSLRDKALWNFMGFPNEGAGKVALRLAQLPKQRPTPLFVNIGKNRNTPIEQAKEDYLLALETLAPFADGITVNISSPNTKNLRDLHSVENLSLLLERLQKRLSVLRAQQGKDLPLLLKISPDMDEVDLKQVLDVSLTSNIDGWILTNTTSQRAKNSPFPMHGGVSGRPVAALSEKMLEQTLQHLGSKREGKLIISVGGILTAEDVLRRLSLGADLVQVYTALVLEGPGFFSKVHKALARKAATTPSPGGAMLLQK